MNWSMILITLFTTSGCVGEVPSFCSLVPFKCIQFFVELLISERFKDSIVEQDMYISNAKVKVHIFLFDWSKPNCLLLSNPLNKKEQSLIIYTSCCDMWEIVIQQKSVLKNIEFWHLLCLNSSFGVLCTILLWFQ